MATGEAWEQSLTEAESGSDAAALSTKAVKTDGGFVLNGTKLYVTSGGVADIYAVMVRTDEAQKKGDIRDDG